MNYMWIVQARSLLFSSWISQPDLFDGSWWSQPLTTGGFHEINNPAFGDPPFMETPSEGDGYQTQPSCHPKGNVCTTMKMATCDDNLRIFHNQLRRVTLVIRKYGRMKEEWSSHHQTWNSNPFIIILMDLKPSNSDGRIDRLIFHGKFKQGF